MAGPDKSIPYLTKEKLVARGAIYKKADQAWASYAVEDKRLITGQNPTSGGAVADLLIAALMKKWLQ